MRVVKRFALALVAVLTLQPLQASYTNFEVSQVHPIALTPSGARLLVVNTPDALLEVFAVAADGRLAPESSIPVGLEPVTVVARTDSEAWVVNHLSDTVSIVDLDRRTTVRTLAVGDEPTDVVFARGRAFVAVSQEDAVKAYDLLDLGAPPIVVTLFSRDTRALAVSKDGSKVYAVTLRSGNQTTVVNANIAFGNNANLNSQRLSALGLNDLRCGSTPPPYPPLPAGIRRNPALTDPPSGIPPVGLIVRYDGTPGRWQDEVGQDWSDCLPFQLPDHDLFVIDAAALTLDLARDTVRHLGTSLFEVSVNPASGRIYVPNAEARNFVRFEHPLGVQGHMVDNRLSIVDPSDPASGGALRVVDLNTHVNRASDPATNLAERQASISQPGMMVWRRDGTTGYLTAIGSRKLFTVDGGCLTGACIFGPDRAHPRAVEVGEGPTGVALHEGKNRLYVLLRFSNSIALVDSATLTKIGEVPLHDPSSPTTRNGRRFLYDGIDTSGHGDAACSSCHLSGDMDGLAWDLGNPEGSFAPYGTPGDNVRFIVPLGGQPVGCGPALCAAHDGFDPQKGPMTTQTLRAMLEPLHWRGDRPTMNAFNKAFVGLMGTRDVGPINGEPAGLSAADMELFRQFALAVRMPPNPYRSVNDALPDALVQVHGSPFPGNPANGERLFLTNPSDALQPCAACHALPFGAAGGKLGGVNPTNPVSPATTALFNGTLDGSPHSDLEVPHMRNLYEKFGPLFGSHAGAPPERPTGFGFIHDGSVPDLGTFLSFNVFNLTAAQVRDIATFAFYFPTGTRPAVGQNLTLQPGTPPTGSAAEEALLSTLATLGDLASTGRHCELVAAALGGGGMRAYHLENGAWVTDVAGEPPVSTTRLRQGAEGPITFLCAPAGSGIRLGGDRDEDAFLNGSDCAPADAQTWNPAGPVSGLRASGASPTLLAWDEQGTRSGPSMRYDVAAGTISGLRAAGLASAGCLAGDVPTAAYEDGRPDPSAGDGYFYLVRAENSCASGGFGPAALDALACAAP